MPSSSATICANVVSWPCPDVWAEMTDDGLAGRMHAQLGAVVHRQAEDVHVTARTGADALGEEGDADAHDLALRELLLLLAAQLVVAGDLHRELHGAVVVARVVDPAGRRLVRELLGPDEAAHAQLDRIDAHLHRQRVDHPLDDVHGLGDAKRAAVGDAAGRLVRVHRAEPGVRALQVIGAGDDVKEPGREPRGLGGRVKRAVVGDGVDAQAGDPAVLGADRRAVQVIAREPGAREVLGPVLDPLDGRAGDDRGGDRADVARIDRHLVAEAAADVVAQRCGCSARPAPPPGRTPCGARAAPGCRCRCSAGRSPGSCRRPSRTSPSDTDARADGRCRA